MYFEDLIGGLYYTIFCCFTVETHCILLCICINKYVQIHHTVPQTGRDFSMQLQRWLFKYLSQIGHL